MHYCIHVFTHGCPSKKQLNNIMAQYNGNEYYNDETDTVVPPTFMWDRWELGGRYGGLLKLDVNVRKDFYEWGYLPRNGPRNNRLFKVAILDKGTDAWDESGVFNYIGYPDGYIRVDGAYVCDILNRDDLGCWGFIDDYGTAFVREYWNGEHFEKHEDFKDQYTAMLEKASANPDMFLTVVDIQD